MKCTVLALILGSWVLGIAVPGADAGEVSRDESIRRRVEELAKLKKDNPEGYARAIAEKKAFLKSKLGGMKATGGSEYQRFLEREKQFRIGRLDFMKDRYPEKFQQFRNQRVDRLRRMAQRDPERFQQFLSKHPNLRQRLALARQSGERRGEGERVARSEVGRVKGPEAGRVEGPEAGRVGGSEEGRAGRLRQMKQEQGRWRQRSEDQTDERGLFGRKVRRRMMEREGGVSQERFQQRSGSRGEFRRPGPRERDTSRAGRQAVSRGGGAGRRRGR